MESLKKNFGDEIPVDVDYGHYRIMQFRELLREPNSRQAILQELKKNGTVLERLFWRSIVVLDRVGSVLLPKKIWGRYLQGLLRLLHASHPRFNARKRTVGYRNLLELSRAENGIRDIPLSWRQRLHLKDLS